MIEIDIKRVEGDYGFEARDVRGHKVRIDTSDDNGGTNFGARPMQLLLMGIGGCSGIDIVTILKKQRQDVTGFSMKISGEREKDAVPALWEMVNIAFELTGTIDPEKARKACELSVDKYCSVAKTLRLAGANINWTITVNNQPA
jgi:putative redox protein